MVHLEPRAVVVFQPVQVFPVPFAVRLQTTCRRASQHLSFPRLRRTGLPLGTSYKNLLETHVLELGRAAINLAHGVAKVVSGPAHTRPWTLGLRIAHPSYSTDPLLAGKAFSDRRRRPLPRTAQAAPASRHVSCFLPIAVCTTPVSVAFYRMTHNHLSGGMTMIFARTTDIAAHLADDMDVDLCVAAGVLDSLLHDDGDDWA